MIKNFNDKTKITVEEYKKLQKNYDEIEEKDFRRQINNNNFQSGEKKKKYISRKKNTMI